MATKGITLKAKLADGVEHQLMPRTRIEMVVNSNGETLTTILAAMKTAIEKGYESIVVRHDTAQVLEAAQKLQARKNIDAVGVTATYGTDAIVLEFKDKSYYPETKTDYVKDNNQVTLTELLNTMQILITDVKADVDTFLADADTSAAARDTLRELQEYINSDATAGAQMLADINELKNKTSKSVYVKTQDTGHGAVLANNFSGEEEFIYPQTKAENVLIGNGSDLATVVTTMNSALSKKPDRTEFRTVNGRSLFKVEGESTDIDLGNIVYYSEVIDL